MDVNGSKSHLVRGADWQPFADVVDGASYDSERGALQLTERTHLFLLDPNATQPDPATRRAAAADGFGNLFWIDAERRRIWIWNEGTECAALFWDPVATPSPDDGEDAGAFGPAPAPAPEPERLLGLAWHPDGYLVVGVARGVLVLDLARSLEPRRVELPVASDFDAELVSVAPGGSVWLLDAGRGLLARLDGGFRPCAPAVAAESSSADFAPDGGGPLAPRPGRALEPVAVPDAVGAFALEALDAMRALVVHPAAADDESTRAHVLGIDGVLAGPLALHVRARHASTGDDVDRSVEADYAVALGLVTDGDTGAFSLSLFAVERSGSQVLRFALPPIGAAGDGAPDWTEAWSATLDAEPDYLPLPYFAGRALARVPGPLAGDVVRFDVNAGGAAGDAAARWIRIRVLRDARFDRRTVVGLGGPLELGAAAPDAPHFDSREPGCVWHRLFARACVPAGASVRVEARAHDDRALLDALPFVEQPDPYRRRRGSALPLEPLPEGGALAEYELLFQGVRGRYLQLRLVLEGNGRVTPEVHHLRIVYPRFSWADRFLPATYVESEDPGRFTERWLANFEGVTTDLEGRVRDVRRLFDPRSVPSASLEWLAAWVGVFLDPLWSEPVVERSEERRRLLLRLAPILFARRGTVGAIRCALELLLHPCPDVLLARLGRAAAGADEALALELDFLGLARPTAWSTDRELELLLFRYFALETRPSAIRVVEAFRVREPGESAADAAHRFTIHVPGDLDAVHGELARRLVELEKPAHTAFEVRPHETAFRIGGARLGLETQVAPRRGFDPFVLGTTELADGYLAAAYPSGEATRWVVGRDPIAEPSPTGDVGEEG